MKMKQFFLFFTRIPIVAWAIVAIVAGMLASGDAWSPPTLVWSEWISGWEVGFVGVIVVAILLGVLWLDEYADTKSLPKIASFGEKYRQRVRNRYRRQRTS